MLRWSYSIKRLSYPQDTLQQCSQKLIIAFFYVNIVIIMLLSCLHYTIIILIIIILLLLLLFSLFIQIYPCIPTIFISLSHFMVIIIHISPIESPNVPGYLHGLGIVHRDLGGWNHTCPALRDRFSVGYPNSTCSLSWELYGKNEARQY